MPRFLSKKKILFLLLMTILSLVIFAIFPGWKVLIVLICIWAFLFAIYLLNKATLKKIEENKKRLSPNRKIEKIDSLIIGDSFSKKELERLNIEYKNPMFITAPGRSLDSSFLILKHLTSRLEKQGKVIIIDRNSKKDTTLFDYPYWSLTTKLSKGFKYDRIFRYPAVFKLITTIKFMGGRNRGNELLLSYCPHQGVKNICKEHNFTLFYLRNFK